jgi:Tfp pilus assembly protein PilF
VQSGAAVAAASHESRPEPEPRVTSRLRIAVDRPLVPDAARLFDEAVQAHRSGDLATAQSLYELYERVLALTPNDADALNNLGVVLSAQQEYDAALEHLRRAASLNPRNAATWNNIGTVLREQGHSDEAIAAFRQAISIDPGHQAARIGLAQQYLSTRALDGAKALLEEVLAASPSVAEAHYTLGQVLELQGDRQGAVRSYSAFLRLAPERLASHAELVRRRVEMLSNP